MRSFRYIPLIFALMCLVSLFFLLIQPEQEDSMYLDQPLMGISSRQDNIWTLPSSAQWNTTSDYFTSSSQQSTYTPTPQRSTTYSTAHQHTAPAIYQTSNHSMQHIGGGNTALSMQHFNVFHPNQSANHSTFSNTIQYQAVQPSQHTSDVSKALAMSQSSAAMSRVAMKTTTNAVLATSQAPVAHVSQMAITTFDANYSVNGIRNKMAADDPFGGGDIGGTPNPIEPGQDLPLGDTPILFILLMALSYMAYVRFHQAQAKS